MKARTYEELALYIEEHPCARCGTPARVDALEIEHAQAASGLPLHTYVGRCASCGAELRYAFERPERWPTRTGPLVYGGNEPSELFTAKEWSAIADKMFAAAPADPSNLASAPFFEAIGRLNRARAALVEATKGGLDVTAKAAQVQARLDRYIALRDAMNARNEAAPPAPTKVSFGREVLKAHEAWLARGRTGDGRLVLENAGIGGMALGNLKIDAVRLVHVSFDGGTVDFASLRGAELIDCSAERTNFSHSVFDEASLVRCRFGRASLVHADLKDVRIEGGDFRACNADRGRWNRVKATGVDFRGMRFGDCVLDAVIFEGCDLRDANLSRIQDILTELCSTLNATFRRCDLRGASFEGRRFDNTKFIECAFAGVKGKPRLEGGYTVERPDFSPAGDGSDIRGPEAVYALWGTP